jgi:hypothetical protein
VSIEISFADAERGLFGFGEFGPRPGGAGPSAALFRDGELMSRGEFVVGPQGDDGLRVEGDGWGFELGHSAVGDSINFGPDTDAGALSGLNVRLTAVDITGRAWDGTGKGKLRCKGVTRSATGTIDSGSVSLLRSVAVPFEDGGLLAVAAARPARAEGHGEEGVTAFLRQEDGVATRAEEALLSTQYDRDGEHGRAGLELEMPTPEDQEAPPLRGAGTRVCGVRAGAVSVAFFRWELEGRAGVGRYDISRVE